MDTKSTGVSMVLIAVAATVLGVAVYPSLPAEVAAHWGTMGEVDGYLPKAWGIFMFPYIMLFTFLVWWVIPYVEPMKKNLEAFREAYNGFWLVIAVFLFYVYVLVIGTNVGWEFNFVQALAPGLALFLAGAGVLLAESKRNYFVGIRTPWTLSSDKVWKRTHLLGSKLFYLCAVWTFLGVVFPQYLMWLLFVPLTITVLITTGYSYIEFRRQ